MWHMQYRKTHTRIHNLVLKHKLEKLIKKKELKEAPILKKPVCCEQV